MNPERRGLRSGVDPPSPHPVSDPTLTPPEPVSASPLEPAQFHLDPPVPALLDAFSWARPVRLNGWAERNAFHPLGAAALVLVGAFLLFQGVGAVVIGVVLAMEIWNGGEITTDMAALIQQHGDLLLTANTIGQWVGFTLLALLVARLSTRDWNGFLRIRTPDTPGFLLSGAGWVVFYPLVLWLGQVNQAIPLPEAVREFDAQQADAMNMLLMGADLPTWFLFIAVAITPSICEELMFRGYLQRQVERGAGLVWSIVLVGVLFGLYHLQLSKALPLIGLGIYLGFVVWATGSVWTGALVHLLNNGFAVMAVSFARTQPEIDLEAMESIGIPWYVALASAGLTAAVCYAILQRRRALVGDTPDAVPVDLSAPSSSLSPSHV